MKFSRTLALLLLLFAVYWSFKSLMPPYSPDQDVELEAFSTDRALEHVKQLSMEPHAVGFPGHERVKDYIISELNKMTINEIPLYFGKDIPYKNKLSYRLPPLPPSGAFDVRFKGDTKITTEHKAEIEVMSPYKSLNISYDLILNSGAHHQWVLTSTNGEEYLLEGTGGEITVPSSERFTLELKATLPTTFTLHQNFPNPFNPITTLRYDLPSDALVTLSIYDMLGREITQLVNTTQEAGFKSVQWDATDSMGRPVSAGVYLYQIQAGEFVQTKKMVLLK